MQEPTNPLRRRARSKGTRVEPCHGNDDRVEYFFSAVQTLVPRQLRTQRPHPWRLPTREREHLVVVRSPMKEGEHHRGQQPSHREARRKFEDVPIPGWIGEQEHRDRRTSPHHFSTSMYNRSVSFTFTRTVVQIVCGRTSDVMRNKWFEDKCPRRHKMTTGL